MPSDARGTSCVQSTVQRARAWLGPEDAALWIAGGGAASVAEAAVRFGVSEQRVNYRLNISGARKRVARAPHLRIVE